MSFQPPTLQSKHRVGAQPTVLLWETQQWMQARGTRRKALLLASQGWPPPDLWVSEILPGDEGSQQWGVKLQVKAFPQWGALVLGRETDHNTKQQLPPFLTPGVRSAHPSRCLANTLSFKPISGCKARRNMAAWTMSPCHFCLHRPLPP